MRKTTATKPRRELTQVTITSRYPAFRSGRLENWSAASTDGVWKYERIEDAGTPWVVIHLGAQVDGGYYGTLTAARAATADGTALACIDRMLAHERGEHAEARDSYCGRC